MKNSNTFLLYFIKIIVMPLLIVIIILLFLNKFNQNQEIKLSKKENIDINEIYYDENLTKNFQKLSNDNNITFKDFNRLLNDLYKDYDKNIITINYCGKEGIYFQPEEYLQIKNDKIYFNQNPKEIYSHYSRTEINEQIECLVENYKEITNHFNDKNQYSD